MTARGVALPATTPSGAILGPDAARQNPGPGVLSSSRQVPS